MIVKVCSNCKHWEKKVTEEPCKECLIDDNTNQWEPLLFAPVMPNGS